jgi:ABC-type xylose transport system permease subunit
MERGDERLELARLTDSYDLPFPESLLILTLTLLGGVGENLGDVCPEIHALIQCRLNEIRVDYVIKQITVSRSAHVETTYRQRCDREQSRRKAAGITKDLVWFAEMKCLAVHVHVPLIVLCPLESHPGCPVVVVVATMVLMVKLFVFVQS